MLNDIKEFLYKIRYAIILILVLWWIEIIDRWLHLELESWGTLPMTFSGLKGILFTPLLHGDWGHLYNNTFSLFASLSIVITLYPRVAPHALSMIWLGSGLGIWLIGRDDSYHIGASGVIYGLVSFIFWTGIFKKNPKSIALALLVLSFFAGMFEAIFPNVKQGISWEGHLSGAIVGIVAAFILKNVVEENEQEYYHNPWANDDKSLRPFLPADIFEKTKQQRYQEWLEAERLRLEEIARQQQQSNQI